MAQTADIKLPFNDLITYVPKQLRKPMITSLIDNLFNRFLTHDESVPLFGYVGTKPNMFDDKTPKVPALTPERDINAVVPVLNFKVGDELHAFTFQDLINRAKTIGIDGTNLDWMYSQGNNFAPPIDFDKFTNFFNYYWVGKADPRIVAPPWNPELRPEYYTIAKHVPESLQKENVVVATTEPITLTGSGFNIIKFELEFIDGRDFNINVIGSLPGGLVPVSSMFSLSNLYETRIVFNVVDRLGEVTQLLAFTITLDTVKNPAGEVIDIGRFVAGDKFLIDAPFISRDYKVKFFGSKKLKGKISEISSYNTYQTIDGVMLSDGIRVLVKDNADVDNGIYIVRPEIWERAVDFIDANMMPGAKVFVKTGDTQTKTFWISKDTLTGFEFNLIPGVTKSNTNDWQDGNFWIKNTDLPNYEFDRFLVTQAQRPIIEYSGDLQLNQFVLNNKPWDNGVSYTQQKTYFNQLPHFDLFRYDGTHSGHVSSIFYYEEDLGGRLDRVLQKRVKYSTNDSRDFMFNHGAHDEGLLFYSHGGILRTVFHPGHRKIIVNPTVFKGGGNGKINIMPAPNASQQIWTLRATSPTTFEVFGTKNKKIPAPFNEIPIGIDCYFANEFSATITAGSIPFQIGDTFTVQIGALEKTNYVFKDAVDESLSNYYGGARADTKHVGDWMIPRMFYNNPYSDNHSPIEEGVLYSHFLSILSNQISQKKDLAFGGNIKLWSEQQNLLASLLMQRDLTPISMINLAQQQYENALNQITDIYQQTIIQYLADGGMVDSTNIEALLDAILKLRTSDNDVRQVLFDSTAPVVGFPATLPMLGISQLVEPRFEFDATLGQDVLICHDGHAVALETDVGAHRRTLLGVHGEMKILRSDMQFTPAVGSFLVTPPATPYKGELWVKPISAAEQVTLIFNVRGDGNLPPAAPKINQHWYHRSEDILYVWDGAAWIVETDRSKAWHPIDFAAIQNTLLLMVETRMFAGINPHARKYDFDLLVSDKFQSLLSDELFTFAAVNNLDPLAPDYDAADAFTWNYSRGRVTNFAKLSSAVKPRWYDVLLSHHRAIPGVIPTARPNLEPFKLLGFATLAAWQSAGTGAPVPFNPSYISSTPDRLWSTGMWTAIKAHHATSGLKLSVDILTDDLLPPYVSPLAISSRADNALTNIGPSSPTTPLMGTSDGYKFGDNGPVEAVWRKSIDFKYSQAKALLRFDPLAFLGFCWGFNWVEVDGILYDGYDVSMPGHRRFRLHGETIDRKVGGTCTVTPQLAARGTFTLEFTAYDTHRRQNFTIRSATGKIGFLQENAETVFENHSFLVEDGGRPFRIGDKFEISTVGGISVNFVPQPTYLFQGFGQTFAHALRAISIDANNSYAVSAYRKWDVNMGYRAAALVSTEDLKVSAGPAALSKSAYTLLIKKNSVAHDRWLQSLRVQVTKFGKTQKDADDLFFPIGRGEDWEFRIEGYNPRHLDISYFDFDTASQLVTFNALSKSHTDLEWYQPTQITDTQKTKLPVTIVGVQNVVNFLYGYSRYLASEGWEFTSTESSNIDYETGRNRNWQLEIEKFVDVCYGGLKLGQGHVINPFMDKVWLNQPTGLLSEFYETALSDVTGHPGIYDALGVKIKTSDLNILRSNARSEISANTPIFSVHAQIDEYEHLFIFNNYAGLLNSGRQLYHPFSGSKEPTYKFNGKKQANKTLRPEYAGHFILGNNVLQNLQASTDNLAGLYDANTVYQNADSSRNAMALLGFSKKDYLENLDITDNSHFNFWRGLIHAKGTNMSVSAYLNNDRFKDVKLDEFWAYKIAEYGDSRQKAFPELKLSVTDSVQQFTKLQFDPAVGEWSASKNPHGELPGFTVISSADEAKWTSLEDLGHDATFLAEIAGVFQRDVVAGELVTLPFIADNVMPSGKHSTAQFEVVNGVTVKITHSGVLALTGYGPASPKYNPVKLFNYVDRELIEEIPVWHPARGIHTPNAMGQINIVSALNPAKFNYSTKTDNNFAYDPLRPWGDKEVGRVWFNTANLSYIPYFDKTLFTDVDERLNRWGTLAEHATVDIWEWVKSAASPYEYNVRAKSEAGDADIHESIKASGEVAGEQTYVREREWQIYPIAWSNTPVLPDLEGSGHPSFFTSFSSELTIEPGTDGHLIYLDTRSFKDFDIVPGMHIGAWDWDEDYPKPLSEMVITDSFTKKIAVMNLDGSVGETFTTVTTTIGEITDDSDLTLSLPIETCGGKVIGYAFSATDIIDPSATSPLSDCDGVIGFGYPISSSNSSIPIKDCDDKTYLYLAELNFIQLLTQQPVTVDVEVISHQDVIGKITLEPVDLVTVVSATSTAADPVWETPIYVRLVEESTGKTDLMLLNTAIGTTEARDAVLYVPAIPEVPEIPATPGTYLLKITSNMDGSTGIGEFPPADLSSGKQIGVAYTVEVTVDSVPHMFSLLGTDVETFDKLIAALNLFLPASPVSIETGRGILFTSPSVGSNSNIFISGGNLVSMLASYSGMERIDGQDIIPAVPEVPEVEAVAGITPTGTHGAVLILQAGRPYTFISEVFGLKFTITPKVSGTYAPEAFQEAIIKALIPEGGEPPMPGMLFLHDAVKAKTIVTMIEPYGLSDGVRTLSNDPITADSDEEGRNIGWTAWRVPTQAQLDADGKQPNSSWKPYIGDQHDIDSDLLVIQDAIQYFSNPLLLNDGTKISKYSFTWSDWNVLHDTVYTTANDKSQPGSVDDIVYVHSKAIDPHKTTVYLNGIAQLRAMYVIHGKQITAKNVPYGAMVTIIIRKTQPSAADLKFNPDIQEDYSYQHQYKIDFEYVSLPVRDTEGAISRNDYYFWVKNKTTPATKKKMSVAAISQEIKSGPPHYITFQNLLPATETHAPRYDAITLSGLNYLVTKDDTFKLRFTRNFTLRDDPQGLDLKDTHAEWALLREHQRTRIPAKLWEKLTESVIGQDLIGNPIPSLRRVLYDERNGSNIRYGFGEEQALAPAELLRASITYIIQNTKLTIATLDGSVPDYITFLDLDETDSWFSSVNNAQETMALIWSQASNVQVNEIFFAAMSDILACNYELTDLFKTSRLSAYSIRDVQTTAVTDTYN